MIHWVGRVRRETRTCLQCVIVCMCVPYAYVSVCAALPYESCKIFKGPAEMPFQNWYTASTNHFQMADSVRWKSKTQLG